MIKHRKELSQTNTSERLRHSARVDLGLSIALVIGLTALTSFFQIDLLEGLYDYSRAHEDWELDEIIIGLGWVGIVAVVYGVRRLLDIRTLNLEIASHAYYDIVTGLPNRVLAIDRLNQMLASAQRRRSQVAVLFLDFDNFKAINDNHGHAKGDMLIKSVGERLALQIRQGDTVARLGGDEFLILIDLDISDRDILPTVSRIVKTQKQPHQLGSIEISVGFSVGVALFPKDANTPESLLKAADMAMYQSKSDGKGQVQFYCDDIGIRLTERYKLEKGLKHSIQNKELYLVYQPQIDLRQRRVIGYEALCRWRHQGDHVPPDIFIKIAEETGFIHELGRWVLQTALAEGKAWTVKKDAVIAVNVSARQLQRDDFVDEVRLILEEAQIPPHHLELEITETVASSEHSSNRRKLQELHQLGVKISLDDFGTGYSSLVRLRELQVNQLKIDRSFVSGTEDLDINRQIIKAIISLAESLDLTVIAEGVETAEQMEMLQQFGCDYVQGYYFSRPVRAEEISDTTRTIEQTSASSAQAEKQSPRD
ncbi:EAL domain-containing protein [Hahella sp. CR1]|uniref:putative bifunctional diguanylate cyclase/phosphodiesterase n=1 Tax=Hahella sp. CR1 TaxID=2992807 RepID=UPI0024437193|nr:EAL domain-containing protein [Hahella sp. CR1]MDG9669404.1 EAL domain-containing protein [Hahella sp. CR1]